ncbi:MAG: UvrD-helicase domain-containing protein [Planctomycetota bacterium]|nr:UvrD-helicase domain-containing protein [Planctomycetota bacterium]
MSPALNPAQQRAVSAHRGPLAIIAGPGSGKTRVMTHRVTDLVRSGVIPGSILAITFTNKAADVMLRRTMKLLDPQRPSDLPTSGFLGPSSLNLNDGTPVLRTFHSFCARLLRRHLHRIEPYSGRYTIYDGADQQQLIGMILKELQLDKTTFPPRRTLSRISHWKSHMTSPEQAGEESSTFHERQLVRIFDRYQELLEERDAVDFDDLLLLVVRLLQEHPDVLDQLRNRFQFVMIDEFQDTNRPQYLIAKLLSEQHRNLCVTGDPDQSIYSWRGASPDNFRRFKEDFPEHTFITLDQNYRSTPQILEVAGRLAGTEFGERKLFTENADGTEVRVQQLRDERSEAARIADHVESWIEAGCPASEIAVLYRVNSLSRTLEEEFVRRRIVYTVIGGMSFYERREVKDILAYLRVARSPKDDVALHRIVNTPARGIGKVSVERFQNAASAAGRSLGEHLRAEEDFSSIRGKARKGLEQFKNVIEQLSANLGTSLPDQVALAIEASGYLSFLEKSEPESWQERVRNLEELVAAAAETEEILASVAASAANDPEFQEIDPLSLFLERIALVSDAEMRDDEDGQVSLMTLHGAKGLEFDRVIIAGAEETLIPHARQGEVVHVEEERRLLYVGVTRARKELCMTHASWRRRFQEREPRMPSSFFTELEGTSIVFERNEVPAYSSGGWSQNNSGYDPAEAVEDEDDGLHQGAWIRHEILGRGVIVKSQGHGASKRISVRFEQGGEKQLVVAYAPVTPISPPDEEWEPC